QGVELVMVPGAHEKILEEPWVGVLGQELSTALRRAHDKHSQDPVKPDWRPNGNKAPAITEKALGPVTGSAISPFDMVYPQLFEARVGSFQSRVAVRFEGAELSYRDLSLRANQLGHYLRQLGVGPECLVGVVMDRSLDLAITLMGIMKAGGAYLP